MECARTPSITRLSCCGSKLGLQLLGKHGVAGRWREQLLQGHQALAEITAGQLARAGVDVDVAADAVEIESQRVDEGLARIFAESFAILYGAPAGVLDA